MWGPLKIGTVAYLLSKSFNLAVPELLSGELTPFLFMSERKEGVFLCTRFSNSDIYGAMQGSVGCWTRTVERWGQWHMESHAPLQRAE